jgi:hypothetical protein
MASRHAIHTETPGNAAGAHTNVHGKMMPMVRKLYMNADQGDITLVSPEAFLLKTSGLAAVVAISPPCPFVSLLQLRPAAREQPHPDVI